MKFLKLINGIPTMTDESSAVPIYDEYISIVTSGASGDNELNGPISAVTNITLPNSGSYIDRELEVYLNGQRLEYIIDYEYVGSGAKTQLYIVFDLVVGDRLRFRVDRTAVN